MNHVVLYSGGVNAFIAAHWVREQSDNVLLLFADTGIEDADTYRFIVETAEFLQCPLVTLVDKRTPHMVPNHCDDVLKRIPLTKYIRKHYRADEVMVYTGLDASEQPRAEALRKGKLPYQYRAPLVERHWIPSMEQKVTYCEDFGIKPPRLTRMGFPHNNCGGFCVRAGLGQFKLLFELMPERYAFHEKAMRNLPFLEGMTMTHFREAYLEPGRAEEFEFDFGGCGCGTVD